MTTVSQHILHLVDAASDARASLDSELAQARAEIAQLRVALETNRRIATAQGILMARHRVRQADAFDMLSKTSQNTNRKLYDIALDVLVTGDLPGKTCP